MERRDFIKKGVVAGAALSLTFEGLSAALSTNKVAVETAADMVAVMGGEPKEMLDKALEALGGIEKFVKRGQKIVIKPNVAWDRAPEMAGNTNPDLVEALVRKCLDAGASKVTVFDNTCDAWQRCYETSGIEKAVRAAGGIMMPANTERYYREVKLPRGINLKSALVHESLIEADAWINVPVLKDHGGAKLTSAMKNYMGIVWDRRVFHQNDLQQCIADICTWEKKPVLNIVDAYRIMHQNGPQGRSLADVATLKSLIASPDIVAIDTAALRMFNQVKELDIEAVRHIGKGEEFRLGTTDLDKLNIKRIRI